MNTNCPSMSTLPPDFSVWIRYWKGRNHAGIWTALPTNAFPFIQTPSQATHFLLEHIVSTRILPFKPVRTTLRSNGFTSVCDTLDQLDNLISTFPVEPSSPAILTELELDGKFFWELNGVVGYSWFPSVATLQIICERQSQISDNSNGAPENDIQWELTFHPNIFTNNISVISGYSIIGGYKLTTVQWAKAAVKNRQAIRDALDLLSDITRCRISYCQSDLVNGVEPNGFAESAEEFM